MTFTQGFKPALNKDGYARCEYTRYEVKSGKSKVTDQKTGEVNDREWELLSIYFQIKGAVRGTDKTISITTNLKYEVDNLLGITLNLLGFEKPDSEVELDDEGFEVVATTEDDEGFEELEHVDLGIEEFLDSIKGNVYIAKVAKATEGKQKGYWQIDARTIQLFKVAEKVENNGKAKEKSNSMVVGQLESLN